MKYCFSTAFDSVLADEAPLPFLDFPEDYCCLLSVNQLVDGPFVDYLIDDRSSHDLITAFSSGRLAMTTFPGGRRTDTYLKSKLQGNLELRSGKEEEKEFVFSWLENRGIADKNDFSQRKEIYKTITKELFGDGGTSGSLSDDVEKYVSAMRYLFGLEERFIDHVPQPGLDLETDSLKAFYKMVLGHVGPKAQKALDGAVASEAAQAGDRGGDEAPGTIADNLARRSFLYNKTKNMDEECQRELRQLFDMAYNYVTACRIFSRQELVNANRIGDIDLPVGVLSEDAFVHFCFLEDKDPAAFAHIPFRSVLRNPGMPTEYILYVQR